MPEYVLGSDLTTMRCQVCRQVLNFRVVDNGPRTYFHRDALFADHEPVPAPVIEATGDTEAKCDFCSAPNPQWAYPVETAVAETVSPDGTKISLVDPEGVWAACNDCATLIDRKAWGALAKAAARRLRETNPVMARRPINQAAAQIEVPHRRFVKAKPGQRMMLVQQD